MEELDGGYIFFSIFSGLWLQVVVPWNHSRAKIPDHGLFTVDILEDISPMTMSEVVIPWLIASIDALAETLPELFLLVVLEMK